MPVKDMNNMSEKSIVDEARYKVKRHVVIGCFLLLSYENDEHKIQWCTVWGMNKSE